MGPHYLVIAVIKSRGTYHKTELGKGMCTRLKVTKMLVCNVKKGEF